MPPPHARLHCAAPAPAPLLLLLLLLGLVWFHAPMAQCCGASTCTCRSVSSLSTKPTPRRASSATPAVYTKRAAAPSPSWKPGSALPPCPVSVVTCGALLLLRLSSRTARLPRSLTSANAAPNAVAIAGGAIATS